MYLLKKIIVFIFCMFACGCSNLFQSTKPIEVIDSNKDAELKIIIKNTGIFIEIFSKSGLGYSTFRKNDSLNTCNLVFQFHLKGLEELKFIYNNKCSTVYVSSIDKYIVHQQITDFEFPDKAIEITDNEPNWFPINFIEDGLIEVKVPTDFLRNIYNQFEIRWIDFYR
ncbi:MAG: hypothetical protein NTX22_18335 [Ignavibacteriales bacterium]|nr:hypothetical protein [Ignavibacteriales bacterium]